MKLMHAFLLLPATVLADGASPKPVRYAFNEQAVDVIFSLPRNPIRGIEHTEGSYLTVAVEYRASVGSLVWGADSKKNEMSKEGIFYVDEKGGVTLVKAGPIRHFGKRTDGVYIAVVSSGVPHHRGVGKYVEIKEVKQGRFSRTEYYLPGDPIVGAIYDDLLYVAGSSRTNQPWVVRVGVDGKLEHGTCVATELNDCSLWKR